MSNHNAILILETKGPEFRVQYVHNINEAYGEFNGFTNRYEPNSDWLFAAFDNVQPLSTKDEALREAARLDKELGIHLEDGICCLDTWRHIVYNNL